MSEVESDIAGLDLPTESSPEEIRKLLRVAKVGILIA